MTVADTVGAGDSFMSGLVDGLWSAGLLGASHRIALGGVGADVLTPVLERCVRIAAITVSRPGANPPRADEVDRDDRGSPAEVRRGGHREDPPGGPADGFPLGGRVRRRPARRPARMPPCRDT